MRQAGPEHSLGVKWKNNTMLQNDKGYAADLPQNFYHAERVCSKSATKKKHMNIHDKGYAAVFFNHAERVCGKYVAR